MMFIFVITCLFVANSMAPTHASKCSYTSTTGLVLTSDMAPALLLKQDVSNPTEKKCFMECCNYANGECDTALFFNQKTPNCYLMKCAGGCQFDNSTSSKMVMGTVVHLNETDNSTESTTVAANTTESMTSASSAANTTEPVTAATSNSTESATTEATSAATANTTSSTNSTATDITGETTVLTTTETMKKGKHDNETTTAATTESTEPMTSNSASGNESTSGLNGTLVTTTLEPGLTVTGNASVYSNVTVSAPDTASTSYTVAMAILGVALTVVFLGIFIYLGRKFTAKSDYEELPK